MASGEQLVRTRPLTQVSSGALSAGRVVGIDGSGTISYAETTTPVAAVGILANDVAAAGGACSIYMPGSLAQVTLKANTAVGVSLGVGVAADNGQLVAVATTSGGAQVLAVCEVAGTAGNKTKCRIVEYLMAEDVP